MSFKELNFIPADDVKMEVLVPISIKKRNFPIAKIPNSNPHIKPGSIKEYNNKVESRSNFPSFKMALPNVIGVIGKIAQLKNRLISRIKYQKLWNLAFKQRDLINDLADGYLFVANEKKEQSQRRLSSPLEKLLWNKIYRSLDKALKGLPLFKFDNPFTLVLNILLFFLISIKLFVLSIQLFIWGQIHMPIMNSALISAFLIEIFMKLNSTHFKEGVLVEDRSRIARKYLKGFFLLDVLSLLSLFLMDDCDDNSPLLLRKDISHSLCELMFFFKIPGFLKIVEKLESSFTTISAKLEEAAPLFLLFFKATAIVHMLACIWSIAAEIGKTQNNPTWWDKTSMNPEDLSDKYVWAFYFVITTLVSVGYGDISPQTKLEICLSIFTMSISCCFLGYFISNVNQLLSKFNNRLKKKKENIKQLTEILKRKMIDPQLQRKIIKYLVHVWKEEETDRAEKKLNFVEKLNSSLKDEYLLQTNGKILKQCRLFSKIFTEETIKCIVHLMQSHRYDSNEVILECGDITNDKVFIVAEGTVELCFDIKKQGSATCFRTLKVGDFFGEMSFFDAYETDFTARSLSKSTVFTIERSKLLSLLAESPEDYEKFCMLRDKLHIYNKFEDLEISCPFCEEKTHPLSKCPHVNKDLTREREKILARCFLTDFQNRAYQIRRTTKSKWITNIKRIDKLNMKCFRKRLRTNSKIDQSGMDENRLLLKIDEKTLSDSQEEAQIEEYQSSNNKPSSPAKFPVFEENVEPRKLSLKRHSILMEESINTNCVTKESSFKEPANNKQLLRTGFDKKKEYSIYFPYNNASIILNYDEKVKNDKLKKFDPSTKLSIARSHSQFQNLLKFQRKSVFNRSSLKLSSPLRKKRSAHLKI